MNKRRWIGLLASIAVTALAVHLLLTDELIEQLRSLVELVKPLPLLGAAALSATIQYMRGWRFGILLHGEARPAGLALFRISALLTFFNYALPFRTGEASFVVMAQRAFNTRLITGASILVVTRILDLVTIAGAGGLAVALAIPDRPVWTAIGIVVAVGAAGVLLVAPMLARLPLVQLISRKGRWPRLRSLAEGIVAGLVHLDGRHQYRVFAVLTVAIWVAQAAIGYICMSQVLPETTFAASLLAVSAATFTFSLPVNGVGGVGPAQAAWAFALTFAAYEWSPALTSGLLNHAVLVASATLLAALLAPFGRTRPSQDPAA
jgi:uncharacterized membrane protein YbhN (UPF0104 family)